MPPVGDPVVVVGMGGSGLEIIARALRCAGVYIGNRTNGSHEDALEFVEFDYRWAPPVIAARHTDRSIDLEKALVELSDCCERHTSELPAGSPWGWKHAPSAHVLPVLAHRFSSLRVVHVIRDGRDMAVAYGPARTHVLRLGRALLDDDVEPVTPGSKAWSGKAAPRNGFVEATPLRQAAFWAAINRDTADFGEAELGDRYLRLRWEDLAGEPRLQLRRLIEFAELDAPLDALIGVVPDPDGGPNWPAMPPDVLFGMWLAMDTELRRFGFDDGAEDPRLPWPPVEPEDVAPASISIPFECNAPQVTPPTQVSTGDTIAGDLPPALGDVRLANYDFIDLGCSSGGSLRFCQARMEARGVGVDIDPEKVARARAAGVEAYLGDATNLQVDKEVGFVSMMDFLEHLPSLDTVQAVLASASRAATDFLFIVHPSFEGEEYLRLWGLQQYWHAWSGHTAHAQVADYCQMFDRLRLHQYAIRYKHLIRDSSDASIHAVASGVNQGPYDPGLHPPKPDLTFERPLWRSQHIMVALRAFDPAEWRDLLMRLTRRSDDDPETAEAD
jgi:hypothetical protein